MRSVGVLFVLVQLASARYADCEFPRNWIGRWFHLGFPEPLEISETAITNKGKCIQNKQKNTFIMEENDATHGKCFRCMVIYEKHFNVLQYKESFCEVDIDIQSVEWLCNTITGDAPLYSMFRKEASLVKCPFRGPFSFSYSKGGSGQVCKYPPSYMDTCSDATRLQLRYQACTDVPGSEIAKEEMECLATWKEGSSRYLVAKMNHTHVYTDEARYRCFVYERERTDGEVVYKMAQSFSASCLGLWNVNEGYKTFAMKKLESDTDKCYFPAWMGRHHDWTAVDGLSSFHLNKKGRSLRLQNQSGLETLESHATCHSVIQADQAQAKIVAHVKAGCDSGFVCMVFYSRDKHVIQMRYGEKSRHPSEACLNYYFTDSSPLLTLVSGGHNTRPCPFSGRYSLAGPSSALAPLIDPDRMCDPQVFMHAGCSSSADLLVESRCLVSKDEEVVTKTEFTCHGKWRDESDVLLVLSSQSYTNSVHRDFVCMSYTEQDGVLFAAVARNACGGAPGQDEGFNVTSSGPCLQALTGAAGRETVNVVAVMAVLVLVAIFG